MALDLGSKKYINVIDRTVPEVYNHNKKLSRLDIIEFCWALKSIGVDMIEITAEVLKKIARLPKGIEFILRIASEEEIALLNNSEIRHVIVR
ncbi:MAG: citramalate synthase, partial [Clostridia bacterium]|nr:citramalate synthase [Clostridia bacterium]